MSELPFLVYPGYILAQDLQVMGQANKVDLSLKVSDLETLVAIMSESFEHPQILEALRVEAEERECNAVNHVEFEAVWPFEMPCEVKFSAVFYRVRKREGC